MKTGGGKNFSCFFQLFSKSKILESTVLFASHRSNAEANMS